MENSYPLISVVVVAHDRRDFIKEALESLNNQTLDKRRFEVLVVKNYEDEEIDSYASSLGFKLIMTEEMKVGSKMAIGVAHSRSEIVAFLEDDDLFEKGKLQAIADVFSQDSTIGMVHNSYSVIGKSSNHLYSGKPLFSNVEIRPENDFVQECRKQNVRVTDFAFSSCVSVRKDIIRKSLEGLKEIQSAPDYFFVFSCLNSSSSVLMVSEKLTKYRLHQSQSIRFGTFSDFIGGNLEIREKWVSDYSIMSKYFTDLNVRRVTDFFKDYNKLIYLNLGNERVVSSKTSSVIRMIHSPDIFRFYEGWWLILLTVLSAFAPVGAQKFYHLYRRKKYYDQDQMLRT